MPTAVRWRTTNLESSQDNINLCSNPSKYSINAQGLILMTPSGGDYDISIFTKESAGPSFVWYSRHFKAHFRREIYEQAPKTKELQATILYPGVAFVNANGASCAGLFA